MRVYCGLASAGQRIPVAVVDDAGRLLASQEVDDTPAGYAAVCALIADRCAETGSVRSAMATDSESNLVPMLLAASGEPLAVTDAGTIAHFLPKDPAGTPEPQQRAVALARALQAGALAASPQPAPRDLAALRPVLTAHRAATTGRTASVAMLRELLRELYPAALRAFPDPGAPLALAVLERLADPVQVALGQAGEVAGQLAAAGHPEAETAVAALRQAVADSSVRSSGAEAVGATVRSGVAAVRSADSAAAALVGVITEQVEPRTSGQGFAAVPPVSGPPVSTPPASGPPVSGAPISGAPVSGSPAEPLLARFNSGSLPIRRAAEQLAPPSLSAPLVAPPPSAPPASAPTPASASPAPASAPPGLASAPPGPGLPASAPPRHEPVAPQTYESPAQPRHESVVPPRHEPAAPTHFGMTPPASAPVSATPNSAPPGHGMPSSAPPAHGMPSSAPPAHGSPTSAPPAHGMPSSAPPAHGSPNSAPPAHEMPSSAPPAHRMPNSAPPAHGMPNSAPPAHGMPNSAPSAPAAPDSAPPVFTPPTMSPPLPAAHPLGSQPPTMPPQPVFPQEPVYVEPPSGPQSPAPLPARSAEPAPDHSPYGTPPAAHAAGRSPNTDELPTTSGFTASNGMNGGGDWTPSPADSSPYGHLGRPQGPVQPIAPHHSSAVPDQTDAELSLLSPDELPTSNIRRPPEPTRPSEPTSGRLGALIEFPRSARRQVPSQQHPTSYGEQARRDTKDEPTQEYRPPSPRRHVPAEAPSSSPPLGENDGDLLIFAQARSAWFTGDEDDDGEHGDWRTEADAGWNAAEAASRPTVGGTTGSGLPRRVPSANLVPGAAPNRERAHVHPINRDAAQLAAHTAGYFRGWNRARQDVQEPPYPSVRHQ